MSELKPVHYRLHLEPDLRQFRFYGKTEIEVEASAPVQEIPIDALDLAVWNCRAAEKRVR